ncbi:hypothetical protein MHUMG1_04225 [Metarhizium humberi]|uniref:DUF7624 domain-containing protein n=1 Tax=Metarhizium humberi TaxID=2596975 RepID=A0A9P8MCG0_9HYPO|nr:hypothetical protein MHUMG1_04225 [Metarhizium humberi]
MSISAETDGLRSSYRTVSSPPPVTDSAMLRPNSVNRVSSNSMNILSPSDIVGPSPVTSNGTETTEIEDDALEDVERTHYGDMSQSSELLMLSTNLPENFRQASGDEAVSVIHAPESFASWTSTESTAQQSQPSDRSFSGREEENSAALNSVADRLVEIDEQTEAEEDDDGNDDYSATPFLRPADDEITALRAALKECWTLCNTLASLSAIHRARVFYSSGTPDAHEKAWKTCWKLCQRLYDNQDEDLASHNVRMNLELCRDFCQALFDVRQKKDETSDSVLRVSFELNNHLYSAQDSRKLPEPFRERTLDFYITLCHRLMKQRSELAEETDHLLSACWTLAEMLFSLRQNKRDGNPVDEELLGSAVQACWDLCDIFRDGWTQIRPDRNTPRPSQTSFFPQQPIEQSGRESRQSNRSSLHSKRESVKSSHQEERPREPPPVPETPVTEFEDTPISPESRSPQMPNIMVLGTPSDTGLGGRWSSNTSNISSYSRGSNRTSSTATTTTATEDPNISRSKLLVLRAAMNIGFNRDAIQDPMSESTVLHKFVQGLPAGSFGSLSSHATLLQQYKSSVLSDKFLPRNHALPVRGKRVMAQDMAKSVLAMSNSSPRYAYLRDLFKFVFQFGVDEAESRRNVSIAI